MLTWAVRKTQEEPCEQEHPDGPQPFTPTPAGTAGAHAARLVLEAAHRHVAGGQECLRAAMLVPAALWTLGAFSLGTSL